MNKLAWATDTHFDHTDETQILSLSEKVKRSGAEGLVLTGDISNSQQIVFHLSILERALQLPVYFVLGNHDYYGGTVKNVRAQMKELTNMSGQLKYLPTTPYVVLNDSTALVGHDGWYDALYGNYKQSNFIMNDWTHIGEFVSANSMHAGIPQYDNIVVQAREMALAAVQHVHDGIKGASRYYKNIIVATHFPPFEEAHLFRGTVGGPAFQPWYTSKMMGDMLRSATRAFSDVQFTVLCGHTHGKFSGQIEKNLSCHVGHAKYGNPDLAEVFTLA